MNIIEKIQSISNINHAKGCNTSQIKEAQKELGIEFPSEYIDYVKEFGAISFYGTEWTGLNVEGYLNVVEATKQERELNESFPMDCFVIENLGIDGIVTVSDSNGVIYNVQYSKKNKICNSLSEYLNMCIDRRKK